MIKTHNFNPGGIYKFESLATANSVFFKNKEEIILFKNLVKQHLKIYLDVCNIYVDKNGYNLIVRVKQKKTLLKNYKNYCDKRNKEYKLEFLKKPWKIVSDKMRIFKSVYVKAINKLRGRQGALVKHSFSKFSFNSINEFDEYKSQMENGQPIESQADKSFEVSNDRVQIKNWVHFRARKWSETPMSIKFKSFVRRIINHNTPQTINPIPHSKLLSSTSNFPV